MSKEKLTPPPTTDCVEKTKPAANSLTNQRIEKLFRMFCTYTTVKVAHCDVCILHDIPWEDNKGHTKNLCYAIWHEDVLNV